MLFLFTSVFFYMSGNYVFQHLVSRPNLRLIRESEIDTKWRIHITLHLAPLDQPFRIIIQKLLILSMQLDQLGVSLDAVRVRRLGQDGASTVNCKYSEPCQHIFFFS